jgi:hypothetical protein
MRLFSFVSSHNLIWSKRAVSRSQIVSPGLFLMILHGSLNLFISLTVHYFRLLDKTLALFTNPFSYPLIFIVDWAKLLTRRTLFLAKFNILKHFVPSWIRTWSRQVCLLVRITVIAVLHWFFQVTPCHICRHFNSTNLITFKWKLIKEMHMLITAIM